MSGTRRALIKERAGLREQTELHVCDYGPRSQPGAGRPRVIPACSSARGGGGLSTALSRDAGGALARGSLTEQTRSLPVGWRVAAPLSPARELGHGGTLPPDYSRGRHALGTVELMLRP